MNVSISVSEKTIRTSAGMRDALFDCLDGLRDKSVTAQEATAASKICSQIINSITVEIEFYKHVASKVPDGVGHSTTLALGNGDDDETATWRR